MRLESRAVSSCYKISAKRKNQRIDWTPDVHERFVYAIKKLGNGASPVKILSIMNVDGLNRYHVASHFQRYKKSLKEKNALFEKHINVHMDKIDNAYDVNISHVFEFTICNNIKTCEQGIVPFSGFCDVF